MERSFKGIWIPKEIWLNKELKVMEKLFLVEIDSLDNDEGCFASNDYFSNFFDLSKNRCSEIIKSLERKGLITISYKYKEGSKAIEKRILKVIGKPNTPIRNIEEGIRNIDSPIRNIEEGYSENCEDNNINNNNINNNTNNNTNNNYNICTIDEIWTLYPKKKGKADAVKKIPKILKTISEEELKRCIERYKSEFKNNDYTYMVNGSTFFNGRYEDYLDENYTDNSIKNIEEDKRLNF